MAALGLAWLALSGPGPRHGPHLRLWVGRRHHRVENPRRVKDAYTAWRRPICKPRARRRSAIELQSWQRPHRGVARLFCHLTRGLNGESHATTPLQHCAATSALGTHPKPKHRRGLKPRPCRCCYPVPAFGHFDVGGVHGRAVACKCLESLDDRASEPGPAHRCSGTSFICTVAAPPARLRCLGLQPPERRCEAMAPSRRGTRGKHAQSAVHLSTCQ